MGDVEFGRYRVITELGRGGMADVFLAVLPGPQGFNKLVVLKRLRHNFAGDVEIVSMLMDEARLAARLNHPNVVQMLEIGQHAGEYFLAMEYLDGQPLNRIRLRAAKTGRISPEVQYRIFADVLGGLHHAHELTDYDGTPLEVVHRDVTPHNVFLTYDGQVKLVDFGVAKAARRASETRTGIIKGKVRYMAPEQALGNVDRRADIFSVGIMLWEAATAMRPWKDLEDVAIVRRLTTGMVPSSPRAANPAVPEEIDRICLRALAPSPDDRYATAAEMQRDLEAFLRSPGTDVSRADIGRLVADLFASERKEQNALIDRGVSTLDTQRPVSAAIPASAAGSASMRGATSTLRSAGPAAPTGSRRRLWRAAVPLTVAALAIAPALWWMGRLGRTGQISSSNDQATVATAAAPAAIAEPALVRVEVRVTPADAAVFLDDAPWTSSTGMLPRDGRVHRFRAEAPGHAPVTRDVTLDVAELTLELELAPEAATPPRRSPPPAAPARGSRVGGPGQPAAATAPPVSTAEPPAAPPVAIPSPATKPTAPPLDTSNPWATDRSKQPPLEKEKIWAK